jgi:signal transduction histidine kinase
VADEGRDEVGDLGRALAAMQRQLQRQEAARRRFVATASHELRTPLASLSMTLELAEAELQPVDGVEPGERLAQARSEVALARGQASRLTRLASDLLDLSRLDAEVPLRNEAVDVGEVCRAVVAELPRDPAVALRAPDARCWALGDPGSVARVLRILLDNAARAAGPGGAVAVTLSAADGAGVALAVRDDGPGVAPEDRERIFERFARGRGAPDGGFGLGLPIARELARRMQGELGLAPDAPPGACFTLRLRAAAPSGTSTSD